MAGRLDRLLRPATIAVVGGREAEGVIAQCDRLGFTGEVWPVNPRREAIGGRRCHAAVADLPGAPDAAFVGVNRKATPGVLAALAARGAGGAVCYASGFREADAEGDGLQAALLEAAGEMPILGPNCYGLINYLDGALLWPDEQGGRRLEAGAKGVAIVTQSSNLAISMTMQRRGLPLAYVVTAGNQAQTGVSEIAAGLLEDPRVTALGLHIEGFDDVAAFQAMAAKARGLGKPIVALKVGRSVQGRAAAITHTASLAGSDAAAEALLRRLGIARVPSIPAFLETLKLLHLHGPLAGFSIASLSCSGGEAALMADAVVGTRLRYTPLGEAEATAVGAVLGPLVTVDNPLDYHTYIWGDRPAMTATFAGVLRNGYDLTLLVLDLPRGDRCDDGAWWPTLAAFEDALAASGGKGAVVASLPENLPEAAAEALMAKGVAPLCGIEDAMIAAGAAATIGETWARPLAPPLLTAEKCCRRVAASGEHSRVATKSSAVAGLDPAIRGPQRGSSAPLDARLKAGHDSLRETSQVCLDEASAKARLAAFGIAVPEGRRAASVEEAVAAGAALGFPLAVKALGLAHKSEAGGLRLGLRSAEALRVAAADLLPLGDGLLVERQVEGGVAELLVGLQRDPQLGLLLTLGAGGVLAELLQDSRSLLLPASEDEIREALAGLRIGALLRGYRGWPRGDVEGLVALVLALGRFAEAEAVEELDLNPVIVRAEGCGAVAVDALIRIREETP